MARRNYNRRRMSAKQILSLVLGVFLIVGCVAGGAALFGSEKTSVSSTAFTVGGLDDAGEYLDQKTTIFTDKLIECQGLEITPNVKNTSTYKVFLYDSNKEFIEATEAYNGVYKLTRTDVQYCRIMITPADSAEEDFVINFWEVWDYANDIEIKVNRKQDFQIKNYFESDKADKIASYDADSNILVYITKDGYGASKLANVEGVTELEIAFESAQPEVLEILFFTETAAGENTVYEYVSTVKTGTDSTVATVTIPSGATHMVVNYDLTEDFAIHAK